MRRVAFFMTFILLVQNVSNAYVIRDVQVRQEKIIPFSFISDTKDYEDSISIKGLNNVKIEKISVNNGNIEAKVDGNYIDLEFYNGQKSNSIQTVTEIDDLELEEIPLDNENTREITISPDKKIKEIMGVSGDFVSAEVIPNGKLRVKLDKNAKGEFGYDETKTEKSTVKVEIGNDNRSREIESNYIELQHIPIGNVNAVSGDTSALQEIIVRDKKLKVRFDNGAPKLNEIKLNDGYTYFWIDRDSDGSFRKYNPNSIYSTDRNKITGKGEYLDKSEQEELGMNLWNKNWLDYCGAEINGVRYIYVFDKLKGFPSSTEGEILNKSKLEVREQNFNTEVYTVEFSEDGVLYIPEGKLYSMGELVKGTTGWGEVCENKAWESKETFFNKITGKNETYVKHYKFYYGPSNKKAFGGFFSYPYSCTLEYEHYKPVMLYTGNITYSYETQKNIKGYLYDGWVKISYTDEKTVKDYPPTSPYNIRYNSQDKLILWENGSDDYTPKDKLIYEIQMYSDSWGDGIKSKPGETKLLYELNSEYTDIRIRTIDEVNQVSDWANLSDSIIELSGNVKPNVIKSGEKVDIYAQTKSLSKIDRVIAKCDELGINCELSKIKEKLPDYYEISFEVMADFLEEDEYVYSDNRRYVNSKKGNGKVLTFYSDDRSNGDMLEVLLPKEINFSKNGTIIFPSGNYLESPLNIFVYNKKRLYLHMLNELGIVNKITGKKEMFFGFCNDVRTSIKNHNKVAEFVPQIIVNNFEYIDNTPSYTRIDVDRKVADKPIVIRWNTDAHGITAFDVSIENTLIYSYSVEYSVLEKYIENIEYIKNQKYLKRYVLSTIGYTYPNKRFVAKWAKIALSVLPRYNVQEFPWLGYKVNKNEYVREEYITNYNNDPRVRNVYRLLILDEYASDVAVKKYLKLIKSTNFPIKRKDETTIFGKDVLDYNCEFEAIDISTDSKAVSGKYEIELTATDIEGKTNKIMLPIIVKNDESQMQPEEEENKNTTKIKEFLVGRFFYKDGQGYLEELSKSRDNVTEGFICAGETLGLDMIIKDAEFIDIELEGDLSIKTLDLLTKYFLVDKPEKVYEKVSAEYENFPKRLYPIEVGADGESKFRYFYTIPYKTKQTLHSWSTLKNGTLEQIDKSKLLSRICSPYKLKITVNGKEEIEKQFDVFERWDTVLNRDISSYLTNYGAKWQVRSKKQ